MAVYYFNDNPIVAPVTITSENAIESSDLASLRRLQLGTSAQRWNMSFYLGPTDNIKSYLRDSVLAFTSTGATRYTVDLPQPNDFLPEFNRSGTSTDTSTAAPGVSAAQSATTADEGNSVTFTITHTLTTTTTTVQNYVPANNTGGAITTSVNRLTVNQGIPKGRFIRFSGHSKIYLVIESTVDRHTVDTTATIKIYPQLLHTVAANEVIYFGLDVHFDGFYDKESLRGVTYIDGILADAGEVKLVEAPVITNTASTTIQSATGTSTSSATNTAFNGNVNFAIT